MKVIQNPYGCAFCQESFSTANTLVSHIQINHELIKSLEDDIRKEILDKTLTTNVVGEKLKESSSNEVKETSQGISKIQKSYITQKLNKNLENEKESNICIPK